MTWSFAAVPLWAALIPLAGYMLALAALHLRRRPSTLSGSWDLLLLVAGIVGLVVAGPLALLQPVAGDTIWAGATLLLAAGLLFAGLLLAARPRLVVYNITPEQLRPVVAEVVKSLDPGSRWAGETAALPGRGIQVHLDGRGAMRSVSLVALGGKTSAEGWAEFSRRMRQAVGGIRVRRSPWAAAFACGACLILGLAVAAAWMSAGQRPVEPVPPSAVPTPDPAAGASHAPAGRPVAA